MVFSSVEFLFRFLIIFLIAYYFTPKKYKNYTLLLGSLIFYAFGEPIYVLLMILSIFINYEMAKKMCKSDNKKRYLISALVLDVGILFVFKYLNFFIDNINGIAGHEILPATNIALPIGISFYTFQIISYMVDVYKGKYPVENRLVPFATYVSMFPQLIAGPIVNYNEVREELRDRRVRFKDIEAGTVAFVIGFTYKVILANQIGTLWDDVLTHGVLGINAPVAWLGAWSFSFQILFDFAGYSMMAIGLGRIMGFYLPMNFIDPYTSRSATEFWRNWHITLGRWFREYVYIPLGGNRKGKARMIFNLFVTWALTGLWHGASWNFVLWGVMFFVILMIEKLFLLKYLEKSKILSRLYMLTLIPVSWVIFDINSIKDALLYIKRMFFVPIAGTVEIDGMKMFADYAKDYWWLFGLCILCATPIPMKLIDKYYDKLITKIVFVVLFWIGVYFMLISENNPFLYFRF